MNSNKRLDEFEIVVVEGGRKEEVRLYSSIACDRVSLEALNPLWQMYQEYIFSCFRHSVRYLDSTLLYYLQNTAMDQN